MRRLLLLVVSVLIAGQMFAQKDVIDRKLTPVPVKDMAYAKKLLKQHPVKFNAKDYNTIDIIGTPIGLTKYDLQTNSAVANRIHMYDDGRISAVWLEDQENADGGTERGTGYAFYDGSGWQYVTTSGVNVHIDNTKTGWPALFVDDSKEYVANHYRSQGGLYLWSQNIGASGSGWTGSSIEGGFPEAMLWPRAASTFGSDGNWHFYVIAVDNFTQSSAEITGLYLAQSHDGGQTWTASLLPNFSDLYRNGNGDIYAIDARDSIVAIAYFASYGDLTVWKSTDYGQTWDIITVNDFPVDQYDFFNGNSSLVDMDNNNVADTVESTDNTGDIVIDPNGKVHLVFSVMRYLDEDNNDNGAYSYFPYTDGLLYWNEDMGEGEYNGLDHANYVGLNVPDSVQLIAYSFDLDGNGIIWEFADAGGGWPFGTYYTALTSFSSMGVDTSGNIYVAFTTVMEGDDFVKIDANPNAQNVRHTWVMVKPVDTTGLPVDENGWLPPYCVSTVDGLNYENVFPTITKHIPGSKLALWVQWDEEPGLHIRGDEDNATDNYIVAKIIPTALFFGQNPSDVKPVVNINAKVYPNPTNGMIYVENAQNSVVTVYNTLGQALKTVNVTEGLQALDLSDLPSGTYIINVSNEEGKASFKVIKN